MAIINPRMIGAVTTSVLLGLSTTGQTASPHHVTTTTPPALQLAVVSGFVPALSPFLHTLQQRVARPIQLQTGSMEQIYHFLQQPTAPDVIITANATLMQQAIGAGRVDAKSVRAIGHTIPVLWCPSPHVLFRVSWRDTLKQPQLRTLASPTPLTNPLGALLATLHPLPPQVRLMATTQGIDAWRLARRGQADCALTVRGLVSAADRFQVISEGDIQIYAAMSRKSQSPQAAQQLLTVLSSPMVQAQLRRQGY